MKIDDLQYSLDLFKRMRKANIALIDEVPSSAVTFIPPGMKNNLHWQAGHILAVQASLLYRRCGVQSPVEDVYFESFGKGTSPSDWDGQAPPFDAVRSMLDTSLDQLEQDLPNMIERQYPEEIMVSTGDRLGSFADALRFLPIHEAIHNGVITALNRLLMHRTN